MNDSTTTKASWWQRLAGGLKRTSGALSATITDLVMRGPLSPERIEEIDESLIRADLGVDVAARIATVMGEGRYHNLAEVKQVLAAEVEKIMAPVAQPSPDLPTLMTTRPASVSSFGKYRMSHVGLSLATWLL